MRESENRTWNKKLPFPLQVWFMSFPRQSLIYNLPKVSYYHWPWTKQLNIFKYSLNYILRKDFFFVVFLMIQNYTFPLNDQQKYHLCCWGEYRWCDTKITRHHKFGVIKQHQEVTPFLLDSALMSQCGSVVSVHPLSLNTSSSLSVTPNNWIANIIACFICYSQQSP